MGMLEIVLLVAGALIFTISFLLPQQGGEISEETKKLMKDEIHAMVLQEMDEIKGQVDDVVGESINDAMEKTERSLERLTNEKIMAVNEYSDTVLKEIHKNHDEAVFLYDMLNSKHTNLKETVSAVNKTVKEATEAVNNFQKLTPEVDAAPENVSNEIEKVENMQAAAVKPRKKGPAAKRNFAKADMLQTEDIRNEAVENAGSENQDSSTSQVDSGAGRNKNAQILALYKQGKTDVAIAKELGLGVGEVKLVIDLHKNM